MRNKKLKNSKILKIKIICRIYRVYFALRLDFRADSFNYMESVLESTIPIPTMATLVFLLQTGYTVLAFSVLVHVYVCK